MRRSPFHSPLCVRLVQARLLGPQPLNRVGHLLRTVRVEEAARALPACWARNVTVAQAAGTSLKQRTHRGKLAASNFDGITTALQVGRAPAGRRQTRIRQVELIFESQALGCAPPPEKVVPRTGAHEIHLDVPRVPQQGEAFNSPTWFL